MDPLDLIFKAYDVRGTVGEQIDAELCRSIGAAFARFAAEADGASRVLVGRDMRASGVEFATAFAAGAQSQGLDVVDLGLVSTDLVYFAAGRLDAPGAMFTASHNPASYNGIKFCLSGARAVGRDTGLDQIKAMVRAGVEPAPREPGRISGTDLLGDFAEHVRSFIDPSVLQPLKVVADTANGMGGLVVPAVFDALPFELEVLYGELDGTVPNHPADPIQVENQADLRKRVLETGADVGLAFDGDADRVFVVDDLGEPISGSTTTAMVAAGVLDKQPGATILHNLICSKAVPEIITERGGKPIRTKVGHSYIKAIMAETGAAFGG
ncbi:MAG: phosphomannomutase/phosphoglucomutase, partial [Acidimicrobiales bacterium]